MIPPQQIGKLRYGEERSHLWLQQLISGRAQGPARAESRPWAFMLILLSANLPFSKRGKNGDLSNWAQVYKL